MKRLLLGVLVLIAVIIVGGGAAFYFGLLRPPQVEALTLSWGEITETSTTVKAKLDVDNPLPFGLGTGAVSLRVPIHLYDVEAGAFDLPKLELPRGRSVVEGWATLNQNVLPQWWAAYVRYDESLLIRVQPTVAAQVLGRRLSVSMPSVQTTVSIPIMGRMQSTESMTMGFDDAPMLEIARNPGNHLVTSPPPPARPVLTVVSWEMRWGEVTPAKTQVIGKVVLRNELAVPLPIQGLRLGLDMNGLEVIPGVDITPTQPELPPGKEVPLALEANVDNQNLVRWWTSHLQREELTTATIGIGITVVMAIAPLPGFGNTIPLPLVPVPGFRCDIKTDIMGMVNYQMASALGKATGPEPEAATVECTAGPGPTLAR